MARLVILIIVNVMLIKSLITLKQTFICYTSLEKKLNKVFFILLKTSDVLVLRGALFCAGVILLHILTSGDLELYQIIFFSSRYSVYARHFEGLNVAAGGFSIF